MANDDTKVTISTPDGKSVTTTGDQMSELADRLKEMVREGTLAAFGLLNREYSCTVMKVSVPRHVDKESGYIDQSVDMLFALRIEPRDLEYNGLRAAAYEWDSEANCFRAAPGDLVKLSSKEQDFVVEISEWGSADDSGDPTWRTLSPIKLHMTGIVPDDDKETGRPVAEVLILARGLPFPLAGELWYPNVYKLRFKERQLSIKFNEDDEAAAAADADDNSGDE
jgi:hypothetical protein